MAIWAAGHSAFGDAAALPMALILFADTIVLLTLTSFFVANNDGTIHNAGLKIMRTMITNPLVLAVVAGLLFSVTGLPCHRYRRNLVRFWPGPRRRSRYLRWVPRYMASHCARQQARLALSPV